MVHLPELISTYTKILNKISDESSKYENKDNIKPDLETKEKNEQPKKKVSSKKKIRPQINDVEIERMVLKSVFNIKMN